MTRNNLFMVAILGSALLAPAAHAAKYLASEQLLKFTAEHGEFKALKQEFKFEAEVIKACLSFHSEAATQKQNSSNRRKST